MKPTRLERQLNKSAERLARFHNAQANHRKDSDCRVGADGTCIDCGVAHGEPCRNCGGRGFHNGGPVQCGPQADPASLKADFGRIYAKLDDIDRKLEALKGLITIGRGRA